MLVAAVYRHQVEACAEAGPTLLTKHGLAHAWQSNTAGYESLHAYFLESPRPSVPNRP